MRKVRKIHNLRWAELADEPPGHGQTTNKARASGFKYERNFGLYLSTLFGPFNVRSNVWFRFRDDNGMGRAGLDHMLIVPGAPLVVFECKLTHNTAAERQLCDLYWPLVSYQYRQPAVLVEVCRNLAPGITLPRVEDIEECFDLDPEPDRVSLLHWRT